MLQILLIDHEVHALKTNENCQTPTLTTTQPNLNLVGFNTIITLHPPTHHHPPPQELYFYQK